jgi:dihydroxyacetone kinase-like protein
VWKIVGALAERGASLADCKAMAERVRDSVRTLTAAFGTVVNPLSDEPLASVDDDRLVVGVGVHGDAGRDFDGGVTADQLVGHMMDRLIDDGGLGSADEVCLLLNNAGSMTVMELSVVARSALRVLADSGISVHRVWMGSYATTQDLAGFALSVCRLDDELRGLYDAPACGAAFIMPRQEETMVAR